MSGPARVASAAALRTDDSEWNAFVAASSAPSFLQATPWAAVKRPNGWRAARIVVDGGERMGPVGAQVLVRNPRPLPKGFGYAARGPLAAGRVDAAVLRCFTEAARAAAKGLGIAHLRIDPEVEDPDGSIAEALRELGWRPAPDIQPRSTRIVDLSPSEEELLAGLRKKTRQSLRKAQNEDVTVVRAGAERLPEFHATLAGTMDRVGLPSRSLGFFRDLWAAYDAAGRAMMLLAQTGTGQVVSGTLLVGWGPTLVALYGGTNARGRDLNAKYLINWAGLTEAKAAGYAQYDLWGLPNEGIAYFKAGWGGRQVDYVGAWDLVIDPLGARLFETAVAARGLLNRARLRLRGGGGGGPAPSSEAA